MTAEHGISKRHRENRLRRGNIVPQRRHAERDHEIIGYRRDHLHLLAQRVEVADKFVLKWRVGNDEDGHYAYAIAT